MGSGHTIWPVTLRMRTASLVLVPILALTATACGSATSPSATSSKDPAVFKVSGTLGQEPTVQAKNVDVSKPTYGVVIAGTGPVTTSADSVLYRLWIGNAENGKVVQSTFANPPARMNLASEPALFTDGLVGKHIGSRITILAPLSQIPGAAGQAPPAGMTAKSDVVFVFDLLGKAPAPLSGPKGTAVKPPAGTPALVLKGAKVTGFDFSKSPKNPPAGLRAITLIKGTGPKATATSTLTLNYLGTVWRQGNKPFDESYSSAPRDLSLSGVIPGWTKGLTGVRVGSRVLLIIPPKLGYGAAGSAPTIPPNATLVFVVDVLAAG
jgi:peptidylprolyl isomerase